MSTSPSSTSAQPGEATRSPRELDVVVVGAGFAGMYMLHRLRGLGLAVRVFERGDGVGGTWYWNRYPGARCDIESMEYSYQFDAALQQEWSWTERYAAQPEILAYANHVAERFDLLRDIQFETCVESAHWSEADRRWRVRTDRGDDVSARFVVMATGCLSSTNVPDFPGRDSFRATPITRGVGRRRASTSAASASASSGPAPRPSRAFR